MEHYDIAGRLTELLPRGAIRDSAPYSAAKDATFDG